MRKARLFVAALSFSMTTACGVSVTAPDSVDPGGARAAPMLIRVAPTSIRVAPTNSGKGGHQRFAHCAHSAPDLRHFGGWESGLGRSRCGRGCGRDRSGSVVVQPGQ